MSIKLDSRFSREDIERFLSQFDQESNLVQTQCDLLQQSSTKCKDDLDQLLKQLIRLRETISQNSKLLPAYDLKRSQQRLDQLSSSIENIRESIEPRKKFVFKKSSTKPTLASNDDKQRSQANKTDVAQSVVNSKESIKINDTVQTNSMQIIDKSNETIDISLSNNCDLELGQLTNCKVILKGNPNTVRIHNCNRCEIRIGPVSRSIFVNQCYETSFWLSCQQLRIHQSSNSDFWVQITSGGIIEQCQSLRFHPPDWSYEGMENDYRSSNLRSDLNLWNKIQDFDWLVMDKPSPNWKAIQD